MSSRRIFPKHRLFSGSRRGCVARALRFVNVETAPMAHRRGKKPLHQALLVLLERVELPALRRDQTVQQTEAVGDALLLDTPFWVSETTGRGQVPGSNSSAPRYC